MTDREMLEAAAKAAGYLPSQNWTWSDCFGIAGAFRYRLDEDWIEWNPLEDDGDALRLAVTCKLTITYVANETWPDVIAITGHQITEQVGTDPFAATRRAIVRAAAEIGRSAP